MPLLDRLLRRSPPGSKHLRLRSDVLNHLIETRGYKRYLEIGVRDGENFAKIRVPEKHGVDPAPLGPVTFKMTSNDYFDQLAKTSPDARYDLVFIDGLHLAEQVEVDVINSLAVLADGGAIVLHDCNPLTRDAQTEDYDGVKHWNGTVWKAWAKLRATRADLSMRVLDLDDGCGIIERGAQDCIKLPTLDYKALDFAQLKKRRRALLNLVPAASLLDEP